MTESFGDQGEHGAKSGPVMMGGDPASPPAKPDPVIGAGVALFGIFLMGTGGARDAHFVFDAGVLIAALGAGAFVLSVALSAMRAGDAKP